MDAHNYTTYLSLVEVYRSECAQAECAEKAGQFTGLGGSGSTLEQLPPE